VECSASTHHRIDIKASKLYFSSMRTTLTLDDDVAAQLERLRKKRDASLKEIINDVLRRGLRDAESPSKARKPFQTRSVDVGRFKLESFDNIGEVLAIIEGEAYK
jgi:hypothetical protein